MTQVLEHESPPPAAPLLSRLGPRIDSLDLLRGIAILGIFLMNTWTMSMPQQAYTNPAAYSPNWDINLGSFPNEEQFQPLTGLNYWVFLVIHLVADMKFITLFSVLFGAGILLQGERAGIRGKNPWAVHYARMGILLLFGLIHAYLLWYGDILVSYALCGILLFPIRRLPPSLLTLLGMLLIAGATFIGMTFALHPDLSIVQKINEIDGRLYTGGINSELYAYTHGFMAEMHHRYWESLRDQLIEFPTWTFFRCGGCMLLGMALQRRRFFHGAWPKEAYATIAGIVTPIGWMVTWLGVLFNDNNNWQDNGRGFFQLWGLGVEFNYWGSLLSTFGYISFGVLLAMWAADPVRTIFRAWMVHIRAVGRMALSNYIFQTLVATTLFYGHGFGEFGKFSRAELLPVVAITWAVQLLISPRWLKVFRQGPLEYLWHSIVYWNWKSPFLPRDLPPLPPTLETAL